MAVDSGLSTVDWMDKLVEQDNYIALLYRCS